MKQMYEKYYHLLQLTPKASTEDIKKAYRRLAKKYHPDVSRAANAHERFIAISRAYEILIHKPPQKAPETSQSPDRETFYRKAHEQAERHARMRYNEFQRKHEAFQKSGLYDVSLFLQYALNVFLFFLAAVCILGPVYLAIMYEPLILAILFFVELIGIFLVIYIISEWKKMFRLGKFFYSFEDLKKLFKPETMEKNILCSYSTNRIADGKPYVLTVSKIEDVKLQRNVPFMHQTRYKRQTKKIEIPRSFKAFILHFVASGIRLLSIILCVLFLPVSSYAWRLIAGIFVAWIISRILLLTFCTKPKGTYLFTYCLMFKMLIWLTLVFLATDVNEMHQLQTSDFLLAVMVLLLLFDPLLELAIKSIKKGYFMRPVFRPNDYLKPYIAQKYQFYLDVPVWSAIFPLVRWIF